MSCPHERHTDRVIGPVEQHVCFDCAMVFDACPEHDPRPESEPVDAVAREQASVAEAWDEPEDDDPEPEGDESEGEDGEGI